MRLFNLISSFAFYAIWFVGLTFTILLGGKRSGAIKHAAFGKQPFVDHSYHSNGNRY